MKLSEHDQPHFDPAMTAELDSTDYRNARSSRQWGVGVGVIFLLVAVGFALFARFGGSDRLTVGPMEQAESPDAEVAISAHDCAARLVDDHSCCRC